MWEPPDAVRPSPLERGAPARPTIPPQIPKRICKDILNKINANEQIIQRYAEKCIQILSRICNAMLRKCIEILSRICKTLPKAQRTRGLSSSFQSNLLGYSQVQTQILIKLHLQNLDPAFTSKSQLNITSSTKLGIQNTKPSFSISTKIQLHNLCKTSAAKY